MLKYQIQPNCVVALNIVRSPEIQGSASVFDISVRAKSSSTILLDYI